MTQNAFTHRGVMLDLARLTERHDYYHWLLPLLKEWGYNVLHVHFCDNEGSALKFPSHPEMASPHAYTAKEMQKLCEYAKQLGFDVIPEIEAFGHTGFITRIPKYRYLREMPNHPGKNYGLCVFEAQARRILSNLIHDTVEIFQPRIVHVGLDEVNFGDHPTTTRLLKKKAKNALFAEHIKWCYEQITEMGCRMAMWGDHILSDKKEAVLAKATPSDTIIFDWHYYPDFDPSSLEFLMQYGFEIYGAPSIQCAMNRIISCERSFINIRQFSAHAIQHRTKNKKGGCVTGMVVTIWCPYRYIPGTIEYPLALAGKLFSSPEDEPSNFPTDFASNFWGVKGSCAEDVGKAVDTLYNYAPVNREYERIFFGKFLSGPGETFSRYDVWLCNSRLPHVLEAERILRDALRYARHNTDRLRDLLVSAEFLRKLYLFGASHRTKNPGWKQLRNSMRQAWARTRYCSGFHYTGKSTAYPSAFGDRDAIMRNINMICTKGSF